MGNAIMAPQRGSGKVILADGRVHEYQEPLTVAELMLEYPQQVVMELPSMVNVNDVIGKGQKENGGLSWMKALPADKKLEMTKVYIMIPIRRGNNNNHIISNNKTAGSASASASSEEARRILVKAKYLLKSKSPPPLGGLEGVLPLIGRMCRGKKWCEDDHHRHESERRMNKELVKEEVEEEKEWSSSMEERPEYLLSRQVSGKGWKPSLDTITEKNVHTTKVRHWLFS